MQGRAGQFDWVYQDAPSARQHHRHGRFYYQRRRIFAGYQVNRELLSFAKKDAILMHPLPAHRGEEVEEAILDSPQSVVFDQAENRLHMQKAILAEILGNHPSKVLIKDKK